MSPINNQEPEFTTTIFSKPKSRRSAIKTIASTMTIAALSGCASIRKPKMTIKAYSDEQENLVPGVPNYYATSSQVLDDVSGLLAKSFEGRPTKLDGNPNHPNNNGKTHTHHQAEILNLYDPDRYAKHSIKQKTVTRANVISSLKSVISKQTVASTALLIEDTFSLPAQQLIKELKRSYPKLNIFSLRLINRDNQQAAIKTITGNFGYVNYNYKKAQFILSFNHDFLGIESSMISDAKSFIEAKETNESQFISFDDSLTVTSSKADHIFTMSIASQENLIKLIATKLLNTLKPKYYKSIIRTLEITESSPIPDEKLTFICDQLMKNRGQSIISVGNVHSPNIHRLVFYINQLLNNESKTYQIRSFSSSITQYLNQTNTIDSINEIQSKINDKSLKTIISLGVNLLNFAPDLAPKLADTNVIYHTQFADSFSKIASTVVSSTHFLEHWDALLSKEGHLSIVQPLIEPLYNSLSHIDVLLALLNKPHKSAYSFVSEVLKKSVNVNQLIQEGVIKRFRRNRRLSVSQWQLTFNKKPKSELSLHVIPSYHLLDGRYSNNAWLQETPDPYSKLTWGNAFYISRQFAKKNNVDTGDIIRIHLTDGKKLKAPVIILPGQDDQTLSISSGYGNLIDGAFSDYGTATNFITPSLSNNIFSIESVEKTKEKTILADTQMNHGLDVEHACSQAVSNRSIIVGSLFTSADIFELLIRCRQ